MGVGAALNRYDSSLTLFSARQDKRLYKGYPDTAIFCNFGSGAFHHPRWRNFDFPGQTEYYQAVQGRPFRDFVPINLNQRDLKIPLDDESVSLVYCSHTLEHLERDSARTFLEECRRVLLPRGVMRIAVPSTDNDFRILGVVASQSGVDQLTKQRLSKKVASHILHDSSQLSERDLYQMIRESHFNAQEFFTEASRAGLVAPFNPSRPERHISFWDYGEMLLASRDAGFRACIPFYRGSSLAKPFLNLSVFDTTEPHISLYAEFVK